METPVGRALLRLTGVSLVIVATVALVAPRRANIGYDWFVVVPTVVVALAGALTLRVPDALHGRWVPLVVSLAGGVVSGALGVVMRYRFGWDARVVLDLAVRVQSGVGLRPGDYDYLSLFPNTIPLLAIDRLGVGVATTLGLRADELLIVASAVCVAVTLYAVHALVAPVAGRGPALAAQLVTLALVGLSPWMSVPYTDLYAMPFLVGGLSLVCAAWRRGAGTGPVALGGVGIAALAVAYVIKTTPAVAVVAVALVLLLAAAERGLETRQRVGRLAAAGLAVGLFVGLASAFTAAAPPAAGVDTARIRAGASPPVVWWFANGLDRQVGADGVVNYGTYSRAMVDAVEGRPTAEAQDYARHYVADRWAERGPGGTLAFYGDKLVWNWGDGMFWAWGEGPDSLPERINVEGPVMGAVNTVQGFHGALYRWRADATQGLWLAVLLAAGLGLLRARPRRETVLLAVTVLGIAAFTLLFQGRSRYLFTFVPVIVALAATVHRTAPRRRGPGRADDRGLSRSTP
ncbi:MAG: hypothetical protein ABIS35_00495 [Terracoccus sp.]